MIETLIGLGADLDAKDATGCNALHYISRHSLPLAGELFIKKLKEVGTNHPEIIWFPEWVVNSENKRGEVSFIHS